MLRATIDLLAQPQKRGRRGVYCCAHRQKESELCGSDYFFFARSHRSNCWGASWSREAHEAGGKHPGKSFDRQRAFLVREHELQGQGYAPARTRPSSILSQNIWPLAMYWGQRVNTLSVPCRKDVQLRESQVQNTRTREVPGDSCQRIAQKRNRSPWRWGGDPPSWGRNPHSTVPPWADTMNA